MGSLCPPGRFGNREGPSRTPKNDLQERSNTSVVVKWQPNVELAKTEKIMEVQLNGGSVQPGIRRTPLVNDYRGCIKVVGIPNDATESRGENPRTNLLLLCMEQDPWYEVEMLSNVLFPDIQGKLTMPNVLRMGHKRFGNYV